MEGLNDHQVEKILQLMEICSLEFDKAKELLKRTDFNVEVPKSGFRAQRS